MNIAAMRVRVTFQKNTVIVDKYGNHKTGWADYFSCWATVGTSSGSEGSAGSDSACGSSVFVGAGVSGVFVISVVYCCRSRYSSVPVL